MTKPVFNNTPNLSYQIDDKEIWQSRSVAVVPIVIINSQHGRLVCLNLRGSGTPDFQGKWCLPCGYIDFNETGFDAARREVWEEQGLDVTSDYFSPWSKYEQPLWVSTRPTASRQNISMYYCWTAQFRSGQPLPELSKENAEPNEVDDVRWFKLREAIYMDLAFQHDKLLRGFVETENDDQLLNYFDQNMGK